MRQDWKTQEKEVFPETTLLICIYPEARLKTDYISGQSKADAVLSEVMWILMLTNP